VRFLSSAWARAIIEGIVCTVALARPAATCATGCFGKKVARHPHLDRTRFRARNYSDGDSLGPSQRSRRRNDQAYSITSLARAVINSGIVRPSALAVFRLMTSSNWLA
jgi:hypothetical protein